MGDIITSVNESTHPREFTEVFKRCEFVEIEVQRKVNEKMTMAMYERIVNKEHGGDGGYHVPEQKVVYPPLRDIFEPVVHREANERWGMQMDLKNGVICEIVTYSPVDRYNKEHREHLFEDEFHGLVEDNGMIMAGDKVIAIDRRSLVSQIDACKNSLENDDAVDLLILPKGYAELLMPARTVMW